MYINIICCFINKSLISETQKTFVTAYILRFTHQDAYLEEKKRQMTL